MVKRVELSKLIKELSGYLKQPLLAIAIGAVFVFAVLHLSGTGMHSPFWMLYLLPLCLAAYLYGFETGLVFTLGVFAVEAVWIYFTGGIFVRARLLFLFLQGALAGVFVYAAAYLGTALPGHGLGWKRKATGARQAVPLLTAHELQKVRRESEEELRAGIREILSLIRRGTSSLSAAYYCAQGEGVSFLAGEGELPFLEDVGAKMGQGLLGKVYQEGREVHIPRLKKQGDDLIPHHEDSEPVRSLLLLPLCEDKQTKGILFLVAGKEDAYREREVRLGDYALRAIARAFTEMDLRKSFRESAGTWATLSKVSESLFASIDIEEVMRVAVRTLVELVECESGMIALTAVDNGQLRIVLANDNERGFVRRREELVQEENIISFLQREQQPLFYRGEAPAGLLPALRGGSRRQELKSFALLPLVEDKQLSGYIRLGSVAADHFSGYHEQVLELAAGMVSMAVSNARLHREVARLAEKDGLTGLFNISCFRKIFAEKLELVKSLKGALSLLMLDLDHFKQVNDRYGHLAGDQVLKETAAVLASCLREDIDIAARYGGEEFVVMLPGMPREEGMKVAERLRESIAKTVNVGEDSAAQTVSIGVASLYDNGEEVEKIIESADQALYQAKEGGRDQVRGAEATRDKNYEL